MITALVYPCVAGGTISRYQIVDVNGTTANEVIAAAAIGQRCIGVAQAAVTIGQHVNVITHGETFVLAGEAIAVHGIIKTDAAGKASDVATGINEQELGIALQAASGADSEIKMLMNVGVSHIDDVA